MEIKGNLYTCISCVGDENIFMRYLDSRLSLATICSTYHTTLGLDTVSYHTDV